MEAIESLDKECSALGGLFQQVVNDMKVRKSKNYTVKSAAGEFYYLRKKKINIKKRIPLKDTYFHV